MNEEKSELTPSQDFIFIGIRLCTRVGLMFPPPDRTVKILSRVRQLSTIKFCQAREFLSLIGLLNSAADQIPHGRLHLRPFQLLLLSRWRPDQDPLDREIPLPETLLREVWKFCDSEIISIRECCYSHPLPNFHVHRCVQFRLGSPCERGRFNHEWHVVSGGVHEVYQHLGTQGSPARCKTLSAPSKNHHCFQTTPQLWLTFENREVPTLQFSAE
jgi:hypothetical protein